MMTYLKRGFLAAAIVGTALAPSGRVWAQPASLQPRSDRPAGLVVFPKIVVDANDQFAQGRKVDTLIQLTNTSSSEQVAHCFYVTATPRCSVTGKFCRDARDCRAGEACSTSTWGEHNFTFTLSPNQPIGWSASTGSGSLGAGSGLILGVQDDYFIGELKCVQMSDDSRDGKPIMRNDLKGEATIYEVAAGVPGKVDVRSYNGIGIPAAALCSNDSTRSCVSSSDCAAGGSCNYGSVQNDLTLCLGSSSSSTECSAPEYARCPRELLLNHFFDNATVAGGTTTTALTLVPCSENLIDGTGATTTIQYLVYNEFEQRFSSSNRVTCFKETQLSNIDARPGQEATSVFNVGVQGTLAGVTYVRSVSGGNVGYGILGLAEEFRKVNGSTGSSAYNVNLSPAAANTADTVRFDIP